MELKRANKVLNEIWELCRTRKEIKIILTIVVLLLAMKCMYEFGISVGEALYEIIH